LASIKLYVETVFRSRDSIEKLVPRLRGRVEAFDLPENPLGLPMPSSIPLSVYLSLGYGVDVVPHIRLIDHNELGLISLVQGLYLSGVDKILLTMGDRPSIGRSICGWRRSEEAVEWIKRYVPEMRVGLIISLNYPLEMMMERLRSRADFYYVMYLSGKTMDKYDALISEATKIGKTIIPYVIIRTRKNKDIVEHLGQPSIDIDDLEAWTAMMRGKADALLLSVPGDSNGLIEAVETARRAGLITVYTRPPEKDYDEIGDDN